MLEKYAHLRLCRHEHTEEIVASGSSTSDVLIALICRDCMAELDVYTDDIGEDHDFY